METTLYAAMSANGMIAARDGSEEFLSDRHWETFVALAREKGNFIVGRKAFEAVKGWKNGLSFDSIEGVAKVILSRDVGFDPGPGYFAASSPEAALALLAEKGHKVALLAGGGEVNAAFAKAGLLNRVILGLEPAIVGQGVPAFAAGDFTLNLRCTFAQAAKDGIVILAYDVIS